MVYIEYQTQKKYKLFYHDNPLEYAKFKDNNYDGSLSVSFKLP